MWRVTATDREGREVARVEIEAGELNIGRDADRQMILASPSVSRRHCRLRIDGNGPVIMDEGSANGVIVNGVRITAPTPVNQMSRIEVAEFRLAMEPVGPQLRPMSADPSMMASASHPVSGAVPGMPMNAPMAMPLGMPMAMPADIVRLIAEGGPYEGRIFDLPAMQEISVGRAVDNDLVLDDPSLSRKHAKVRRMGGGRLEVEDVNSANGTYVNGRKIGRAQLGPGDTLRFGELMFRLDGGQVQPSAARAKAPAGPVESAPQSVKLAFFGLLFATVLVYGVWLVKLIGRPAAPPRGAIEEAIGKKIHGADALLASAKEAFDKGDWGKAKADAVQALDVDPANLGAARLQSQAIRAEGDESKFKQASTELNKGNIEGTQAAQRLFHMMSPESTYRPKLADQLSKGLIDVGLDFCHRKVFRDCAANLCEAYQVAPQTQKPSGRVVQNLRDAERRARVSSPCVLK